MAREWHTPRWEGTFPELVQHMVERQIDAEYAALEATIDEALLTTDERYWQRLVVVYRSDDHTIPPTVACMTTDPLWEFMP